MKKLICLVLAVMLVLSAVSAFAAEYTDKDTVKKVQQALNNAGYDCGTPDGAAGKKTKAAIKDYQNANGLTASGVIDDELLAALGIEVEAPVEAPAETQTEEEYLFQGIPWGTSYEDVNAALVENGIVDSDTNFYMTDTYSFCIPDPKTPKGDEAWDSVTWWPCHYLEGVGGMSVLNKENIKKTIGGGEIEQIYLGYMFGAENEQIVSDTHLTTVVICYPENPGFFDTLAQNLESTYGKRTKKESLGSFAYAGKTYIWEGGNNTAIYLTHIADRVTLSYGKTDAYITAQQIMEIIEANKEPMADAGL